MPDRLPPLPGLKAFEAAARHENFAAAAKELNLSQSAVSHRVRCLEQHLGQPLFERLPRGLRLTEPAKAYLPSVRRAFDEILSATSGVFGHAGRSVLNIRAPISYVALWLTPLVDRFVQEFPHVEVKLSSSIWAERMASGETDVELRLGRGQWSGFEAAFLFKDALVPVCSPQTAQRIKCMSELADCALIHVMGPEDYWANFFAQVGVARRRKRSDISVDSSMAAAELVQATDRVALLQEKLAVRYIQSGSLVRLGDDSILPAEAMYLLSPSQGNQRGPNAILFEKWLREKVAGNEITSLGLGNPEPHWGAN